MSRCLFTSDRSELAKVMSQGARRRQGISCVSERLYCLMMKDKSSLSCAERQINKVDNFHVQNLVELGFPILSIYTVRSIAAFRKTKLTIKSMTTLIAS